jgi:hypothetical protein
MSEERTFSQEEVNQIVEERIARAREKWAKESGDGDLTQQLQAKDEEIATIRREYHLENTKRAVLDELDSRGVVDEGRRERVMKLVDLEAIESRQDVLAQVDGVAADLPELVRPRGAGSRGSKTPVSGASAAEKPLTREEVEAMSPAEVNSRWDSVKSFLAGERG